MMKRSIFVFMVLILSAFCRAEADDYDYNGIPDVDYTEIDTYLDSKTEGKMCFREYVENALKGENEFSVTGLAESVLNSCLHALEEELSCFSSILLLTALVAFFTPFTEIYGNGITGNTAFYIMYMLVINLLAGMYATVMLMTKEILSEVTEFMGVLTPAYMMGIAYGCGTTTAASMYAISMFIITLGEKMLLNFILPLTDIYLCLSIANHVTKSGMFTKMTELAGMIIGWGNKFLVSLVIFLSGIQSLLSPGTEKLKRSLLQKAAGVIPILGNGISTAAETVLSAGIVLKNIIGAGGVIAIIILCAVPITKIFAVGFVIRISCAVTEPVADKRITALMSDTAAAISLLLKTSLTAAFLFIILIVILAVGTGL